MNHTAQRKILLASGSPRRAELLRQAGFAFAVLAADVDETSQPGEAPADYVLRLALAKARAGRPRCGERLPALGADTAVIVDGEIFGKPRDREHGLSMLARLSARKHVVLSAVALVADEYEQTVLCASEVEFCALRDDDIHAYWATGEPQDKAGAYAIQGRGALFVAHLRGSYSGVMGLPLFETAGLLREIGIHPFHGNP